MGMTEGEKWGQLFKIKKVKIDRRDACPTGFGKSSQSPFLV